MLPYWSIALALARRATTVALLQPINANSDGAFDMSLSLVADDELEALSLSLVDPVLFSEVGRTHTHTHSL
jgi:hypothetical protein